MSRRLTSLFPSAVLLACLLSVLGAIPRPALAVGILVNTSPGTKEILPRQRKVIPVLPPRRVPLPPQTRYRISDVDVNLNVRDQVVQVQVSQTFHNTGSGTIEAALVFPLPADSVVSEMTLMVGGKEFPAKLLDAKAARQQFEEIVRKNQDPALLEWVGWGMLKTSVFPVPAGEKRQVTLKYTYLAKSTRGLIDLTQPLGVARYSERPVDNVRLQVSLESQAPIKNIFSPTHDVEITRRDERHAKIQYKLDPKSQASDFRLMYDVGDKQLATQLLSYRPDDKQDGYFLLLANPTLPSVKAEKAQKTVLLVLDTSGSMSGPKMEQAKGALKFVLERLEPGDLFNIVDYNSTVSQWKPELQKYGDKTRDEALAYADSLQAGGSTNISEALKVAMKQITDGSRPSYVLFLTDGLPTAGKTKEGEIATQVREHNQHKARIFSFGVGYDVNSRLLDRLARDNRGQSEYVRPAENIEQRVAAFYNRIGSPVLSDVKITVTVDGAPARESTVNRVYPREVNDLFAGDQLTLAGRYKHHGPAKVTITGTLNGKPQKFEFPAELTAKSSGSNQAFVEKLWAMRRVGEIIDEIDLKGHNAELVKELVELATRHGIVTPYTSFLADDQASLADTKGNQRRAEERLKLLDVTDGRAGVAQRAYKQQLQQSRSASGKPYSMEDFEIGPSTTPTPSMGGLPYGSRNARSPAYGGARSQSYGGSASRSPAVAPKAAPPSRQIQAIGGRTFYQERGQWVQSTLSEEQQKAAQKVARFSPEYFALVERHGDEVAKVLALSEPVMFALDDQIYLVE